MGKENTGEGKIVLTNSTQDEEQTPIEIAEDSPEEASSGESSLASAGEEVQLSDDSNESHELGDVSPAPSASSRRFHPPSRQQLLTALAFAGVVLLGAVLRFWGLGDKPLHHDESLHAYFSWLFMLNTLNQWGVCAAAQGANQNCYHYNPLLHGPFQFHAIALTYKISQLLGVYDHGVNNFTARIPAATLGTAIVGLPYFLRHRLFLLRKRWEVRKKI